ncbi:reverse transcriptase domain-containing protein [Acutalibacter caecimuris]|uniref:reverse transcriptase domain-containing protein n=1 Tax=Acutalibacter caecimuris TaxID=3093657 RepID=UPI002AC8DE54|nr:reverse transcriptase domain-containing protein [Acutalibacter sp. M00118]
MIKVKITNKAGAALVRELPTGIHQLYHDMREAGISKPPKNILLHEDKDVEVKLSSDSEIGSRLLRVFSKNDTLADANTVAFAVSTAREEILTELEQNIVHNQYLTKEMLFDDIREMTQAAGPVKLTFYCPLVGQLDDGECDEYIDVGSGWWVASQWETQPTHRPYKSDESRYSTLNRTSSLKHVFIVRYADDFKLFCKTRNEAVRLFEGTRLWMKERLGLEISPEKSKIVNLKKQYSEFLGFKLKLRPKSGGWVIKSHMTDKAQEKCRAKIRGAIDLLGKKPDQQSAMRFNATVLGLHQYYKVATNVNLDFDRIAFGVRKRLLCRTKRYRSDNGFRGQAFQEYYGSFKGKVINVAGIALFPVRKISTTPPICFSQEIKQLYRNRKG